MTVKCKDHLGNKYASITDMCKHYNISVQAYKICAEADTRKIGVICGEKAVRIKI